MKKQLSLFLTLIFSLSLFSGCAEKEPNYGSFFYDLSSTVDNLDPQISSTYESSLLLSNMMEGVVKYGNDGTIIPGLANAWEISDDGLTYTFHIREDVSWVNSSGKTENSDGTLPPVTAHDFVFGFQRLFNPTNKAPYASRYNIIENAEAILGGQLPPDSLGVIATDNFTLTITLTQPSSAFLSLLAQPPAYPCNEEFFYSTGGAYGLNASDLLYCGGFYLSKWVSSSDKPFYTLTKNLSYYNVQNAKAKSVTFNVVPNEEDRLTNFLSEQTDSILLSGDALRKINLEDYQAQSTVDTTWSLLFNTQKEPFNALPIRQSLSSVITPSSMEGAIPPWMTSAKSLVPPSLTFGESFYRDAVGEITSAYSIDDSKTFLQEALLSAGFEEGFPEITLAYPEGDEYTVLAQRLQRLWKDQLGLYINAVPLPIEDIEEMANTKEYDLIFLPLRSDNALPITFFSQFTSDSVDNITSYHSEPFDALYAQYSPFSKESDNNILCQQMEQILQNDSPVVPIAFQSSCFIQSPKAHDILYNAETNLIFYSQAYLDEK